MSLYVDGDKCGFFSYFSAIFGYRLVIYSVKDILISLYLCVELSFFNEAGGYKVA
jgi:hypothetical protein